MEDFKFYEVGGKIRDELLGLTNKDVDYVAVPTEAVYSKIHPCEAQLSPAQLMFKALKSYLEEQKFEIFLVSQDMWQVMKSYDYFNKMPVVSEERIREELTKCFKCNSSLALGWLSELTELRDYIFTKTSLWLKPTNEK